MAQVQPTDLETLARLGTALFCGGLIGLERDYRQMPTGFRTMGLLCLGSCIAVLAAIKAGDSEGFSRVAQGIVTGVGFLGAGVIFQTGEKWDVKGLTTAAAKSPSPLGERVGVRGQLSIPQFLERPPHPARTIPTQTILHTRAAPASPQGERPSAT